MGDVDGDGEYEIILKWDPTNSHDNSHNGYTGEVIFDCYKLDGTQLWRINLGKNIRAGAHYTQFLVYDFDGDGKAEMICKTSTGSVDAKGKFVSDAATDAGIRELDNAADYRNSRGRIMAGPELLTVFNGETGKAMHTIWYQPTEPSVQAGRWKRESIWRTDFLPILQSGAIRTTMATVASDTLPVWLSWRVPTSSQVP